MKAIRIILLVLIILGIGLIVAQNFWVPKVVNFILEKEAASQPVDPLAWKTYTNHEFGFSVQYPPNLVPGEQAHKDENALSVWFDDPATGARYGYISVWGRQSDLDNASEYFTGPYPKELPPSGNNSSRTVVERTLGGVKGIEYFGIGGEGTSYDDVFMYKNKYLFAVYLDPVVEGRTPEYREPGTPPPTESYKETYHRIIGSIRIY